MKKSIFTPILTIFILGILLFQSSFTAHASNELLEFKTMTAVSGIFLGSSHPVRGINGGGLPWVIGSAKGELSANGKVEVKVTGLVLDPNDPVVISRGLAGINPSPSFKAVVSCISTDNNGMSVVVNVSTGLFPATTTGNAKIEDHVSLPKTCMMPIIFVTSPGGAWFATSGF